MSARFKQGSVRRDAACCVYSRHVSREDAASLVRNKVNSRFALHISNLAHPKWRREMPVSSSKIGEFVGPSGMEPEKYINRGRKHPFRLLLYPTLPSIRIGIGPPWHAQSKAWPEARVPCTTRNAAHPSENRMESAKTGAWQRRTRRYTSRHSNQ